jgi:hypothetical protein
MKAIALLSVVVDIRILPRRSRLFELPPVEKRLGYVNSSVFLSTEDTIRFQMDDPETANSSDYIRKWWNRLRLTEQA